MESLTDRENQQEVLKDNVSKEAIMVLEADTIVYPRTVMVKSLHAFMANATMSTSSSSDSEAVGAELSSIKFFQKF